MFAELWAAVGIAEPLLHFVEFIILIGAGGAFYELINKLKK